MSQIQEKTEIVRIDELTPEVLRFTLDAPGIAAVAVPGQFVMIRTGNSCDPLLRRPFSISQTSNGGLIQILFKVVGRGTGLLSHCREGEKLSVIGPLGKGFLIDLDTKPCLVGGGMGIAPLLFLAKRMRQKGLVHDPVVFLGAAGSSELLPLITDFEELGLQVHVATDDGSIGHHGLVTEVLQNVNSGPDCMAYVCGPKMMMVAVHQYCRKMGYGCQVSVETSMACGMGACLGCIVPAQKGGYVHACYEGPVFDAEEIVWEI